jgi:hypothetical protein
MNKAELTQLCANEDPMNNSSTELDSDTDYESDADPIPKTHHSGRRKTDFESQSSDSDNASCTQKNFNKELSFDNWKNAIEQKSPSVAPEISWWTTLLTWFTPYRQLFVLTFGLNFAGAVSVLSGYWPWAFRHLTPMVVGNVLFAIGIRSEWVLRFLYWLTIKTFRPTLFPLWLRVNVVGILYHIGKHDFFA